MLGDMEDHPSGSISVRCERNTELSTKRNHHLHLVIGILHRVGPVGQACQEWHGDGRGSDDRLTDQTVTCSRISMRDFRI